MKKIEDFYELDYAEMKVILYLMGGSRLTENIISVTKLSRRMYYYTQEKLMKSGFIVKRKEKKTYRVSLGDKFWELKNVPYYICRKNDINVVKRVFELF